MGKYYLSIFSFLLLFSFSEVTASHGGLAWRPILLDFLIQQLQKYSSKSKQHV